VESAEFTRELSGVEVCCSVLQRVAVWAHGVAVEARVYGECGVCTWIVRCCSVLQCVAVCCSVLQCGAVCYTVVQCGAVCYSVLNCRQV